mmetsp:Transcript_35091/g.98948  ORF Transcript_35091/g.98948 Transcript_35091/m.98948 type:complete len:249 (-) Transcript_35091:77-823(-)
MWSMGLAAFSCKRPILRRLDARWLALEWSAGSDTWGLAGRVRTYCSSSSRSFSSSAGAPAHRMPTISSAWAGGRVAATQGSTCFKSLRGMARRQRHTRWHCSEAEKLRETTGNTSASSSCMWCSMSPRMALRPSTSRSSRRSTCASPTRRRTRLRISESRWALSSKPLLSSLSCSCKHSGWAWVLGTRLRAAGNSTSSSELAWYRHTDRRNRSLSNRTGMLWGTASTGVLSRRCALCTSSSSSLRMAS